MMKVTNVLLLTAALGLPAVPAETKLKLEQLPTTVQAVVREQTKGATLRGIARETEHGKTVYEIETAVNGRTRDLILDQTGAVIEVEQEVDLDSIPPAARTAIEKKSVGGTIEKVETLTKGSAISYEATITAKSGKRTEVAVNADGSPHR